VTSKKGKTRPKPKEAQTNQSQQRDDQQEHDVKYNQKQRKDLVKPRKMDKTAEIGRVCQQCIKKLFQWSDWADKQIETVKMLGCQESKDGVEIEQGVQELY